MMEAAVLPRKAPAKNGKIHLRFDIFEVEGLYAPRMRDEEFEEFCYINPHLRIEQDKHGNIFIMPPTSIESGTQESEVMIDLGVWNRKAKLGKTISPSALFILPDGEKRMSDAAWVSLEKYEKISRRERKKFAHLVPDFIVEVRSPSDDPEKLKAKVADTWMANGVRLAWLIDPIEAVSYIFRPGKPVEEVKGMDKVLSGEEVLPGFEFDLSVLKEE